MSPGRMRRTRIPRSANPPKKLGGRWSDDDDKDADAAAAESASTCAWWSGFTARASRARADSGESTMAPLLLLCSVIQFLALEICATPPAIRRTSQPHRVDSTRPDLLSPRLPRLCSPPCFTVPRRPSPLASQTPIPIPKRRFLLGERSTGQRETGNGFGSSSTSPRGRGSPPPIRANPPRRPAHVRIQSCPPFLSSQISSPLHSHNLQFVRGVAETRSGSCTPRSSTPCWPTAPTNPSSSGAAATSSPSPPTPCPTSTAPLAARTPTQHSRPPPHHLHPLPP
jgi:hypothetical protein